MTDEERRLTLYCLKANSDYHAELCEECVEYPNCSYTGEDINETIIKILEREPILDKIKAEIEELDGKYLIGDYAIYGENIPKYVRLWDVLQIIDKYKAESEE